MAPARVHRSQAMGSPRQSFLFPAQFLMEEILAIDVFGRSAIEPSSRPRGVRQALFGWLKSKLTGASCVSYNVDDALIAHLLLLLLLAGLS